MISQREAERKYNKMLKIEELQGEVAPNRFNVYTCGCGTSYKTVDIDKGVTPFLMPCLNSFCSQTARSTFYNDTLPNKKPVIEFYRPTLKQVLKNRDNEHWLEHIFNGGLDHRKIM